MGTAQNAITGPSAPVQNDIIAQMSQQIAGLTQAVQSANIVASSMPEAETVDDVLASIINPPNIGGKNNGNE